VYLVFDACRRRGGDRRWVWVVVRQRQDEKEMARWGKGKRRKRRERNIIRITAQGRVRDIE
jgi:hypothetical protein